MNSIRSKLKFWLLLGFALMLGASGALKYHFIKSALQEGFDENLLGKAMVMAALTKMEGKSVEFEYCEPVASETGSPNLKIYCQMAEIGGPVLYRSRSLGGQVLPDSYCTPKTPCFSNLTLPGGQPGRAVGITFRAPQETHRNFAIYEGAPEENEAEAEERRKKSPLLGLTVAQGLSELEEQCRTIATIIIASMSLAMVAGLLLVDRVVGQALAKLHDLTRRTRHIHADTLQSRLPTTGMPKELVPICDALNQLLVRLETAFDELNEYAGKVAHELRTPLTILRLKIEQAGAKIDPELAEALQAELHRLSYVVEQSLLIARAEQGRLQSHPRPMDLADVLKEVAGDFSLLAQQTNRRVILTGTDRPAPICADPKHLRQIIHNLLTNAWNHGNTDIALRIKRNGHHRVCLTIFNGVLANRPDKTTLGLGLRVVKSLVGLYPDISAKFRKGSGYYAVRLSFPNLESSDRTNDPGI